MLNSRTSASVQKNKFPLFNILSFLYTGIVFENCIGNSPNYFFMKQTIEKLSMIFIAGLLAAGCNNNDTATTTETTSDTTVMSMADTNRMVAVDTMATNAPMDNSSANATTSGTATPNPAKKGKKGKAPADDEDEDADALAEKELSASDDDLYDDVDLL